MNAVEWLKHMLDKRAERRLRRDPRITLGRESFVAYRLIQLRAGQGPTVHIGERSYVNAGIVFETKTGAVTIGNASYVGGATNIICRDSVSIGDNVEIAWGVTIMDHNSHSVKYYGEREKDTLMTYLIPQGGQSAKDWSNVHHAPIVIKDKAWIGFNAIVLKGVTVGEGAVVGAGSVVTKDVPDWTVVGGDPAQVLYSISPEQR